MTTTGPSKQIPFLDLKRQHDEISGELNASIKIVLDKGVFILGEEVSSFESEWAEYCGVSASAGVASGTDALSLALEASGAIVRGRGDEVITSPLTAGYTALAILNAGAVPVFADIDPQTLLLDASSVEKAISPSTRAIIPVHLYGRMCDMNAICDIAVRHGLTVIEDAAQAHGAKLGGKRAGAFGSAAAYSFYPTKNLGALGDGGAVVSDDEDLIERVKLLRQGGHSEAFVSRSAGRNSRLDEMQAAILRVKLKYLDEWNNRRRGFAGIFDTLLQESSVRTPFVTADHPDSHVFHLYVVQTDRRDKLREHLARNGVATMIHYPNLLHRETLFRHEAQIDLPVAEKVGKNLLSLPMNSHSLESEIVKTAGLILQFES